MVRKLFISYTFNKAYFKIIVALDGIVVLGQLTEKAVPGALVGMNLVVPGEFLPCSQCIVLVVYFSRNLLSTSELPFIPPLITRY